MKFKLLYFLLVTFNALVFCQKTIEDKFAFVNYVIQQEPNNFHHYGHRGFLYLQTKEYDNALKDIEHALSLCDKNDTNNLSVLYNLQGGVYKNTEKNKLAISSFLKSFELDSNNTGAINNLANLYMRKKEYKEAEKYLLKAIAIHPNNNFANGNIGRLYSKIGTYEKAMSFINLLFAPGVDEELGLETRGYKFAERGYILFKTGKTTKALEDLNKSIELSPNNYDAFLYRGLLYQHLSNKEMACNDFKEAEHLASFSEEKQEIKLLLLSSCKS